MVNMVPELVAAIERDRQRSFEQHRLAGLLARIRACCNPSLVTRLARALRPAQGAC